MDESPYGFIGKFSRLSRLMKAEAERRLVEHGVHAGQQFILERLWRQDGRTVSEIAGEIQVEIPTVTRAIQRMEVAGLVCRSTDGQDRRRVRIWLTPLGDSLRVGVPQAMRDLEMDALRLISPEDREHLVQMLGQISAALTDPDER